MAANTLLDKLDALTGKYEEIELLITDPAVIADMHRFVKLNKEYKELGALMDARKRYRQLLNTLEERERRVLELRYGIGGDRAHTLEEVGKEFGVTRERIRQIEAKALRTLRHPALSKIVSDYLHDS